MIALNPESLIVQAIQDELDEAGRTALSRARPLMVPHPFKPSLEIRPGKDELESALASAYRLVATDVISDLWETDLERLCGMRWRPNPSSEMTRAGKRICQIVLGGKSVFLKRPRVRSVDGHETELPAYTAASQQDLLDRSAIEDVTAFVTTGAFPPGRTSRNPIAAEFVERLATRVAGALMAPCNRFEPGLLISSIDLSDQTFLGAVGIEPNGNRRLAGLGAGSADSREAVESFCRALVDKHTRATSPDVFFVDEAPLIQEAIRSHFGPDSNLQRSPHDMRRRVLGLLPATLQPSILARLFDAYAEADAEVAERAFLDIARSLEDDHPKAAHHLLSTLSETLTLHRLADRRLSSTAG